MSFKILCVALGLIAATASHAQTALIQTSEGDISIELNAKVAPITVANFIRYANTKHYDGTIFHRVIRNFMSQGGGFDAAMNEKSTTTSIANEAFNGLKNNKYTIAMARTSEPQSATAQFFINAKNNDFLNHRDKTNDGWGYAVFGKVSKGFEIIDKINGVYTKAGDVPIKPIVITHVSIQP